MDTQTFTAETLRGTAPSSTSVASVCPRPYAHAEERLQGTMGNLDSIQKPSFRW